MNSRMEATDRAFVSRARTGDAEAFRVLVERHSRSLFGLAYRMTGNESDAEDVVQDSFLRAYRQLGAFDDRASFGSWVYRIAVNCSLDLMRARRRRSEQVQSADPEMDDPIAALPSPDPPPDRLAMSGEIRERLGTAMSRLSDTERSAFVLRHFEGMGLEEVSRTLGCQPGAAKHSIFRAVRKLRRALEPAVSPVK
jgi:RNA polymerase sigma-70 factor (ECF subfamily)